MEDALPFFELVERNREHLSQWGETISKNLPDLRVVENVITHPADPTAICFGIWEKDHLVGFCGLTLKEVMPSVGEIGYWIGSEYTNKGFATYAADSLSEYAFVELRMSVLIAVAHSENYASHRVLHGAHYHHKTRANKKITFMRKSPRVLELENQTADL